MPKKPVCLIIRDGWGKAPDSEGNAISRAKTPNADAYHEKYPHTLIKTCGEAVGLMKGNMGNSEVGHLNIGAGRVVYQNLPRITKSIRNGEFFQLPQLLAAIQHCKERGSTLHLLGLINDQGVHAITSHCIALLELCKKQAFENVLVHAFTDGRDSPPKSSPRHLSELQSGIDKFGVGRVATVVGRYFAMDRDNRWERVELAHNAILRGEGKAADSWRAALEAAHAAGETDEFIKPRVIDYDGMKDGDAVIFFNFRTDRARQLTHSLLDETFPHFKREKLKLHYVTFTSYYDGGPFEVVFEQPRLENLLGKVLSDAGLKQLRCAETEKYPHVTFFFNGQVEDPYPGEERAMLPSPKVPTYDLQPEMSARGIRDEVLGAIEKDQFDVYIVNFANCDMVGHTGVFDAVVKAVEVTDAYTEDLVEAVLKKGGTVLVTADHGNADEMLLADGSPMTAHSLNDVPFVALGAGDIKLRSGGALCDIAPTILELLSIKQPGEMSGRSLLEKP